jgi:hypothetical protein
MGRVARSTRRFRRGAPVARAARCKVVKPASHARPVARAVLGAHPAGRETRRPAPRRYRAGGVGRRGLEAGCGQDGVEGGEGVRRVGETEHLVDHGEGGRQNVGRATELGYTGRGGRVIQRGGRVIQGGAV